MVPRPAGSRVTSVAPTESTEAGSGRKLVSIVTPAYNESECVDELARRLAAMMDAEPAYDFEVVIVENGSQDDTWEKLLEIRKHDQRFKLLQLARNFRMDGGLTAGLAFVSGDACVLMTADLQDPPELIHEFLRKWEEGYENIYGVVEERRGTGPIRRFNSRAFYWVAGRLTDGRIPRDASDFRLLDRKAYEAVRGMDERNRFVRGLAAWVGFKSVGVPMQRPPRFAGTSKATTFPVLDLAFKGIFAHSYVPLRLITVTGSAHQRRCRFWRSLSSRFAGSSSACRSPDSEPSSRCSSSRSAGLAFMMGILSEYVGLIYEEVKQRPNYVVRDRLGI